MRALRAARKITDTTGAIVVVLAILWLASEGAQAAFPGAIS